MEPLLDIIRAAASMPYSCEQQEARYVGASDSKSLQGLGFLTALEDPTQGWVGGLLVLNAASRPMEFHCTAPIKPSRAQQILYGATLAPYICGEQIGAALTRKSDIPTAIYFTDRLDMLAVRPLVNSPVVYLELPPQGDDGASGNKLRIDASHAQLPTPHAEAFISFQTHDCSMRVNAAFAGDQQTVTAVLEAEMSLDLCEPFQRVHEALEETQLRKR